MPKGKATQQEIEEFLEEFRSRSRPTVNNEPRPEYFGFLASKNLSQEDAYAVILEDLNYKHYVSGPEDDYNKEEHSDPVWKFKIKKFGTTIYIKLKLYTGKLGPSSKCLSFHDYNNKF